MSELQRRWAKAKMDMRAADVFDEAEEEGGKEGPQAEEEKVEPGAAPSPRWSTISTSSVSSASSASSASSTGTVVPSPSARLQARPVGLGLPRGGGGGGRSSMEPIPWTTFFERELYLAANDGSGVVHHAYLSTPVFSGGSSGGDGDGDGGDGPLFVMHHGAGSSGLSFAVLGAAIRKLLPAAGILSVDARGHGATRGPEDDLRLETLSADLQRVVRLVQADQRWPRRPGLVLVGHSMGGAVVADVAFSLKVSPDPSLDVLGYAVLDVVEGSAMDALTSMTTYLATRPAGFASVAAGIEWHLRSRTLRNATSARTSVPPLLVDGRVHDTAVPATTTTTMAAPPIPHSSPSDDSRPWRWRTDLAATQPFWEDWFRGLSKKFLSGRGGKLLLLAGTDRLDTELTIGQMQGKYALQVFPEAGHFIHEDVPDKTATVLVDFYQRNNRSALVLPPKVSELLAQGKRV